MEHGIVWWRSITGPSAFLRAASDGILSGKSLVLGLPGTCPWEYDMRSELDMLIHRYDTELIIDHLFPAGEPPLKALEAYTDSDPGYMYRRSSGLSVQQYMLQRGSLKGRILWVHGLSTDALAEWCEFVNEFRIKSVRDGVFILDADCDSMPSKQDSLMHLSYNDYWSPFDHRTFFNFIVEDSIRSRSVEALQYASVLTSLLFRHDLESGCSFIADKRILSEDPATVAAELGCEPDAVSLQVWKAQLEVFFPLIEQEKIGYIRRHAKELMDAVNTPAHDTFGNKIFISKPGGGRAESAEDLELGAVCKLALAYRDDNGEHVYPILNPMERDYLHLIHKMRNLLAHGCCCSGDDIKQMIELYPMFSV